MIMFIKFITLALAVFAATSCTQSKSPAIPGSSARADSADTGSDTNSDNSNNNSNGKNSSNSSKAAKDGTPLVDKSTDEDANNGEDEEAVDDSEEDGAAKKSTPNPTPSSSPSIDEGTTIVLPTNSGDGADVAAARNALALTCTADQLYFDLAKSMCTNRPLAKFICTLQDILKPESTVFSATRKQQIKTHFETALVGYQLKSCVDDTTFYTLVAIKEDLNNISMQTLAVPK